MPFLRYRATLAGLALLLPFVVWSYAGLRGFLTSDNLSCLALAFVAVLYTRKYFSPP